LIAANGAHIQIKWLNNSKALHPGFSARERRFLSHQWRGVKEIWD
jgi:hypothetical protein